MPIQLMDPVERVRDKTIPPQYESLLSKTAHLLLEDTDVDTLCHKVFEKIRGPLRLDVYFHYLVREDGSGLELASCGGTKVVREALGTPLSFGEAICGCVAQACQPMNATHVLASHDPRTMLIRSFGIRCYSCKPLMVNGDLVGTLSFGSTRRDEFSEEELDIFRMIARQITLATERRLTNRRLREREQLATIGRMSATLAHEINNPLETLSNLIYLLKANDAATPEQHDLLAKADDQVQRLAEISSRTLDLFRGKNQKPRRVDLKQVLSELGADICMPLDTPLNISADESLFVSAIPGEVRQVLFNLVLNAAHFSPAGEPVTVTLRAESGFAIVCVRDEGQGISEETRKHLFQPFYTTRGENGTGVGLWISREMVERAGGTLTFESDPRVKRGTEFRVRLPLAE